MGWLPINTQVDDHKCLNLVFELPVELNFCFFLPFLCTFADEPLETQFKNNFSHLINWKRVNRIKFEAVG